MHFNAIFPGIEKMLLVQQYIGGLVLLNAIQKLIANSVELFLFR
jgi:hypothetical protein